MIKSPFTPESSTHILIGRVGWNDEDEYYFLGEDDNDGHTLVRVQLLEGMLDGRRDKTKAHEPDKAQGHQIICHISSLAGLRVPPKGSTVYVAIPKGMESVPAAGVIFAAVEKLPSKAGNVKADEVAILGRGESQARVVVKENGTVSMMTTAGNAQGGKAVIFKIGPDGFTFSSPWGNMRFDATGFHVKTKAGPSLDMGAVVVPGLSSIPGMTEIAGALTGYCTISAPTVTAKGQIVNLGPGPNYLYAAGVNETQYAASSPFVTYTPVTNASAGVRISFP